MPMLQSLFPPIRRFVSNLIPLLAKMSGTLTKYRYAENSHDAQGGRLTRSHEENR